MWPEASSLFPGQHHPIGDRVRSQVARVGALRVGSVCSPCFQHQHPLPSVELHLRASKIVMSAQCRSGHVLWQRWLQPESGTTSDVSESQLAAALLLLPSSNVAESELVPSCTTEHSSLLWQPSFRNVELCSQAHRMEWALDLGRGAQWSGYGKLARISCGFNLFFFPHIVLGVSKCVHTLY